MKQIALTPAQTYLKIVEANFKTAITQHAGYIDPTGKKSTGAAGLALQINIKTKAAFGDNRDHFSERKLNLLITMQRDLTMLIAESESKGLSRSDIKKAIYETIGNYGDLARRLS